jgi:HSP20 family molecular chaperone IbpA
VSSNFFEEFYEDMEYLVDRMRRVYERLLIEDVEERAITPLTAVHVQRDRMIVTADLPLVEPSTLEVELVDDRRLNIEARMNTCISSDSLNVCLPPVSFEYFKAMVDLPVPGEKITSIRFYKDVLEVILTRK